MKVSSIFLALLGGICLTKGQKELDPFLFGKFPEGFKFGYATAAYQIEGGWDEDGKGENVWDWWTHLDPSPIDDQSTGDVACDSYHKWQDDVALLKNAHAQMYRFSVAWNRIIPTGVYVDESSVSQEGLSYYNNLIDTLLAEGIMPIVTFFHWDTPKSLELDDSQSGHNATLPPAWYGGWTNATIIEQFTHYADVLFRNFGDRVQHWITFNEPWVICWQGYGIASKAPGRAEPETLPYDCAHNILKAHAEVYHLYQEKYKDAQQGTIGITLDTYWYEPASSSEKDVEAAERVLQFHHGWFASPIYTGDYPKAMKDIIERKSAAEGRPSSRLPTWDAYWSARVKGTSDFLGLNHYTSAMVEHQEADAGAMPGWNNDMDAWMYQSPTWQCSGSPWLKVNPPGFRKLLKWLKDTYGNPEIIVTENGTSEDDATAGAFGPSGLNDVARAYYYTLYINNMLKAILIDGVNITSYTAWSLMDNFEWKRGYSQRFGAHRVDFLNATRPRAPKASVSVLRDIFDDHGFLRESETNEVRNYHEIIDRYTPGEEEQHEESASTALRPLHAIIMSIIVTLGLGLALF